MEGRRLLASAPLTGGGVSRRHPWRTEHRRQEGWQHLASMDSAAANRESDEGDGDGGDGGDDAGQGGDDGHGGEEEEAGHGGGGQCESEEQQRKHGRWRKPGQRTGEASEGNRFVQSDEKCDA